MSSKRNGIFGQGRPENPYEEDDRHGPADVPKKATAAQLAARKIKNPIKPRRTAGATSGLSQFGAPQQSGFEFGASAPAPSSNGNGASTFGFGGNNSFGGGATNSFPPATSTAPSSNFTSSSFPAFGASSQTAAFNPQPPAAGFNFTAGGNNPFASASPAPEVNGSTPAPTFGGSSMFNAQPQSNPFGGLGQSTTSSAAPGGMFSTTSSAPSTSMFGATSGAPSTNMFGTTSGASGGMFGATTGAPSTNMFGATSGAPSSSMFGTTSSTPNVTSTTTSASQPFTFGGITAPAPSTSTPATSSMFGGLGTSTQTAAAPQNSLFSGFGSAAQKNEGSLQTPPTNMFGSIGTSAQGAMSTTATAPASSLFNFNPSAQTSATPSTSLFGASSAATPSASTPAPAPAGNPFAKLPTGTATTPSLFSSTLTPQAQEKLPASNNLFSSLKPMESSTNASAETPKPNLFSSLANPNSKPTATPTVSTPGFSFFGAAQQDTSSTLEKPSGGATLKAPEAPKSSLFAGFSTPQPAKTAEAEKPQGGLFTAGPKPSSGMFSQTFQPEANNSSNLFKPQSTFSSLKSQPAPAAQTPKQTPTETSQAAQETSNPFSTFSTPASDRPNLFSAYKEATPAAPMPTLTGATGPSAEPTPGLEVPKVPKMHVPKDWARPGAVTAQGTRGATQHIFDLTAQLQAFNEKYRQQLNSLPLTADWSSLSLWHYQHTSDFKKKIDNAKKQHATAKGVTGYESALSTKRKVTDESSQNQDFSSSKRARAGDTPATPTPQPAAPTPKFSQPATSTSNMFENAINGTKPSVASTPSATSLFTPKTVEKAAPKPAQPATGFTPSFSASNTAPPASTSSGFKPSFGASPAGGFKPSASSTGGGGFMDQFKKTAKTYEQLAAERKAKAMEEDYDSDDETEEQWSAKYDKKEAERLAEEKKQAAATPAFKAPLPSQASGSTTPTAANPFASLKKPASATPTPSMFTPRAGSPAASVGSVFDAPSTAQTPALNIFGHLSSGPSSNNQDESDEDDGALTEKSQTDQPVGSVESTTPPKPIFGGSETEDDETLEETMRSKKQGAGAGSRGSLLSRMSRADSDEAESTKKNSNGTSLFGQTNGTQTPTNKPFQFFDFSNAGSQTAPPKSDTFAGDQTFKIGTPIKFGAAPATEKKSTAPLFQFQPATPSAAEFSTTPAKPPPSSLFSFGSSLGGSSLLAPNSGLSAANSVSSSVFSSRAGTPLSEAENSAADDDEEGGKQSQVDFSQLTEEESEANDVVFHTEMVLAKQQSGEKSWVNIAKGPLWILKDKATAKCFIRMRLANGSTPLNYQILPKLSSKVTGSSKKMVISTMPAKAGGLQQVLFAVRTPEIAEDLATKYNDSLPSK